MRHLRVLTQQTIVFYANLLEWYIYCMKDLPDGFIYFSDMLKRAMQDPEFRRLYEAEEKKSRKY